MSHTNSTTNYGLPEFLSSDKPAWMGDMNPAFSNIDAQMKLNADAAAQANTDIGTVGLNFAAGYSNVSTYDVGDVVTYNKRMYICDVAVTVPETFDNSKWSYYKCSDIAHEAHEADAAATAVAGDISDINNAIGSTDISAIGDGTLTGAISSVNANLPKRYEYSGTHTPPFNAWYTVTTTTIATNKIKSISALLDNGSGRVTECNVQVNNGDVQIGQTVYSTAISCTVTIVIEYVD